MKIYKQLNLTASVRFDINTTLFQIFRGNLGP